MQNPLRGFTEVAKMSLGRIDLIVKIREAPRTITRVKTFVVQDGFSAYNAFLGQLALSGFPVVVAPWCFTIKFLITSEVGIVRGNHDVARGCYADECREIRRIKRGKLTGKLPCVKSHEA